MSKVYWLGSALRDLAAIKTYYEELEEGLGQKLTRQILDIEKILGQHPEVGKIIRSINPQHRQLVRGHYLVIYRVDDAGVKIAAVIDSRRDFESAWKSSER